MLTRGRKKAQLMANRTSVLPDEIVCYILSLLPTKLAFATTILSKRLTSLCHSYTSSLRFYHDEGDEFAFRRSLRFVTAVLLFPREQHHLPIKELVIFLKRTRHGGPYPANEWLEVAKLHPIESMDLDLPYYPTYRLSTKMFSCRTLVVLKISNTREIGNFSTVDLPSLKTLHLTWVYFGYGDRFQKLLFGAPILEDLYVSCIDARIPYYRRGAKLLPELVKLHFDSVSDPINELQKAKKEYPKFMNYIPSTLVFPDLIHIELSFQPFEGWNRVLQALGHCPKIQHLVIRKGNYEVYGYHEKLTYSEDVLECVSSHLRTCFIGTLFLANYEDDLRFVAYLMKNAKFLQALTLCPCKLLPNQESYVLKKILSLLRASSACKVSLSNCVLSSCNCGFNNTIECRRRHESYCWKTKGSFLDPRKFYALNAS